MYSFKNDYSEGAHPRILQALLETNLAQQDGYGEDQYSRQAVALLKERIGRDDVDIHFLTGGTQVNLTALSSFLRPHEAVISAATGHIHVHEAGAVEATGHKILTVESDDGKLRPGDVREVLALHAGDEHMVKPKLVFVSNSTESGTVYNKTELAALGNFCRGNGLYLYLDGARLGSALCAEGNDMELVDIAPQVDAFYIGGTKNGALLGEALVICRDQLKVDFRYLTKQRGALLAKGRLLGLQFRELFRDDLYFELARHANRMAERLRQGILNAGYQFFTDSPSNQIFPILPNRVIELLAQKYGFYVWTAVNDEHSALRLVTSWATREDMVDMFIVELKRACTG